MGNFVAIPSKVKAERQLLNLDRVISVDQIEPGRCRLCFSPDHYVVFTGAVADGILAQLEGNALNVFTGERINLVFLPFEITKSER